MKKLIIATALLAAGATAYAQETHNRIVGTVKIGDEVITAVTYNRQDFADLDACKAFLAAPDDEYLQAKSALLESIARNHHVEVEAVNIEFKCEKSDR